MFDISKLDEEDLKFYNDFTYIFKVGDESGFIRDDVDYCVDYKDGKIWVFEDKVGGQDYYFDSPDDFFDTFLAEDEDYLQKLNSHKDKVGK